MNQESPVNDASLVEEIRAKLLEIDSMQINEHALGYEELHTKLATALSTIDGL